MKKKEKKKKKFERGNGRRGRGQGGAKLENNNSPLPHSLLMVNVLLHPLNAPPLSLTHAPFIFYFFKNSIFSRPKPSIEKSTLFYSYYIHTYIYQSKSFKQITFCFAFFLHTHTYLGPFFFLLFFFLFPPRPSINPNLSLHKLFLQHTLPKQQCRLW